MQRPWKNVSRSRFTKLQVAAIAVVLLLVMAGLALSLILIRAQRALTGSASAPIDQAPFKLQALPAQAASVFEPVATAPSYYSGVFLEGRLYLVGHAGLTILAEDGAVQSMLRTGIELPASSITGVISARLRGANEPQILLSTAGAGLLLLQPVASGAPTVQQLLPQDTGSRDLTALAALAGGDLLLGTRHDGVLRWDGATLHRVRFALPGLDPDRLEVTALAAVDASSYLIGTRAEGILYAHGGTFEQSDASSGLADNQVLSLAMANDHAYVGGPIGVADFDLNAATFRPARTLAAGLFSNALSIEEGELRVGTLDQGIQIVSLDQASSPRLRKAAFVTAAERIDGFISTPRGLLTIRDGEVNHPMMQGAMLSDRNISALAFDAGGSLYIGYFDHGLDVLGAISGAQSTIRHFEDDHLFCINRLVLDPARQTMAAATANGLVLFDAQGNPRQTLTRRDGLISEHVTDLVFTPNTTVLATPAGITFLSTAGAESLYAFQGLVNNHVYALASDGRGELVAGTLGGLSLLDGDSVRRSLTVSNSGLRHNWVTALLPLAGSHTLVGTYGAGLQILDSTGRFAAVDLPAGVARDLVINPNALYATPTHLYAGTLGHGMLVYSQASTRWTSITAGLPSLNVTAFAARSGTLYVGTENGLVRAREADLP